MAKRLFVSVDLPDRLQEAIAEAREPLEDLPGLRLTDPQQTHVTLTFLGDAEADRLPEVREAIDRGVEAADVASFRARFGGFGVFPEFDYISVVWIGVREGATEMERLHHALVDALAPLGFEEDDHAFTPHVTIARMDHAGAKDTVQRVVRTRDPDIGGMDVGAISLKESRFTGDGPVYESLETIQLEPPSR